MFTTEQEDRAAEEEARSKEFAALMAAARALKEGDDAGVQDLMYKAVWPKRSEPKLTELKNSPTFRRRC